MDSSAEAKIDSEKGLLYTIAEPFSFKEPIPDDFKTLSVPEPFENIVNLAIIFNLNDIDIPF